ncbi:MAG: PAS domain S-box protein [Chitinophagales bacterium]
MTKDQMKKEIDLLNKRIISLKKELEDKEGKAEECVRLTDNEFKRIKDNMLDMVLEVDNRGIIRYISQSQNAILGYDNNEITGQLVYEYIHPDDLDRVINIAVHSINNRIPLRIEYRYKDVQGNYVWLESHGKFMFDEQGEMIGVILAARDITARKRAEQALMESEARLRQITDGMLDLICQTDVNGIIQYLSFSHKDVLGFEPEGLLGMSAFDLIHPKDRRGTYSAFLTSYKHQMSGRREHRVKTSTGDYVWMETVGTLIWDEPEKNIIGAIFGSRNITDRKLAENARRKSEAQLKRQIEYLNTLLDNLNEMFLTYDRELRFTYFNKKSLDVLGYKPEELIGTSVMDYIPPKFAARVREGIQNRLKGKTERYVAGLFCKDGSYRHIQLNGTPIIQDGEITGGMCLAEDITERDKAEKELEMEKERLAITLRSIRDGVVTTDTMGNIILINRVAEDLTGWTQEEANGKPIMEVLKIVDPDSRLPYRGEMSQKVKDQRNYLELTDYIMVARDGSEKYISISVGPIKDREGGFLGIVVVFRDITEAKKHQEELLRTNQLESLGLLAGGIAHDFNNLLTVIIGNVNLASMISDKREINELLSEAQKASLQARNLTRELLTFARGGAPIKRTSSVKELIIDSASFALRGTNVKSHYSIPDGLWPVDIDTGQIAQVLNNLTINAFQAMPNGGTLHIRAENVSISDSTIPGVKGGHYVRILMEDEGIGIPESSLNKIFDPYFTTKPTGAGLGLTIAYSVVRSHEGYLGVKSRVGEGTTFEVLLPASTEKIVDKKEDMELLHSGKGQILVMDDDARIRDVVSQMLTKMGYNVITTSDGQETVEVYSQALMEGCPFDAVIMDLTIPGGMGGKETITHLLKIDPNVKAVASSGYSNDPVMAEHSKWGFKTIIAKPYGIVELGQVMSKLLV